MPAIPGTQASVSSPDSGANESPARTAPPGGNSALTALFARIARNAERVIIPINDCALDEGNKSPAFFCVHSLSGAGGTDFNHLAKLMPEIRFYGIQAPPTKMQDAEFGADVESLGKYYADALIKFQPKGQFLLGGWSAGAIIGLEVAQNLRRRGRVVRLYVAIDAAPENTDASLPAWHPLYLFDLARNLPGWIVRDAMARKQPIGSVLRLGVAKAVGLLKAALKRKSGRRDGGPDAIEGFVEVSRYAPYERSFMSRLYAALLAYTPRKYAGTVVAYEATAQPLLNLPQVRRVWTTLAPSSTIVSVKGTHLSILQPGDVEALAADLRKRIADLAIPVIDETPIAAPSTPAMSAEQLEKKTA